MRPELAVEALARRFQALDLSRAEWTHEAHLVVGLWHVARFGATDALLRLRTGIRALNEHNGVPNTPTGGYHETITRAYVLLLDEFLARRHAGAASDSDVHRVAQALLEDPIADRQVLFAYWTRDTLMSSRARGEWVAPDRSALPARGS